MASRPSNRLDEWADQAAADARAAEAAKRTKVTVYIHPRVAKAVRQIALDEDKPANSLWLEAMRKLLAERGRSVEEIIHGEE
jgi:hypothetical protein